MRFRSFFFGSVALWMHVSHALLEEKFMSFTLGNDSFDIAGATVSADANSFVGVHIALKSLVDDPEQITGTRPVVQDATVNSTTPDYIVVSGTGTDVVIGSANSSPGPTTFRSQCR
jgi:hypothetical protein